MTLVDGSDVQLMGLAVTASGIDRSGPTLVPVDRYISPHYVQHSSLAEPGVQPLKDFLDFVHERSPDATQTLHRTFVDGDHVVLHYHVKRFPEDPGMAVVDIFRVADGMIVEHWDVIQEVTVGGPNTNSMF